MVVFYLGVGLSGLAWVYLLALRGGFWRADQILTPGASRADWPAVVAIIPARNEAESIGRAIASHMAMDYPGPYQVIVVDDGSDDGTADIARAVAQGGGHDLTVTAAPPLAKFWSGKLWALNHGLDVAQARAGAAKYVLFTDADIVYDVDTVRHLVAKAEAEDLSLVSLMALLDARGLWGGLLIPAFIFFFQKLYPFAWVNDATRATAGAAGGSMLMRTEALRAVGGVAAIRATLIDDCALAARLKHGPPRRKIWLGLTRHVVSLRDNRKFRDIWQMVTRTAYTQLKHSPLLLAGSVLGLLVLYLAPPLAALTWPLHGQALLALLGAAGWALMVVAYLPTVRFYGRSGVQALALPLAAGLYVAMTIGSALRYWRGPGARWKGRDYQARG